MSSTALADQPFERVAPTWEVGRPAPQRPAPSKPSGRGAAHRRRDRRRPRPDHHDAGAAAIAAGLAFGLPMSAGVGQRSPHPQSAGDLAQGFELTAGELRLDLRDVAFPAGTTRTKVEVGFGQATVIVPRGVEVVVDGRVVAGQARSFGRAEDGLGVDTTQVAAAGPRAPRLELDARVGFGQLRVVRG